MEYSQVRPDIASAISEASAAVGVPPQTMFAIANRESRFDPMAKNKKSSASGLFQFLDATWDDVVNKHGSKYGLAPGASRFDVKASAYMGAEFAKENAAYLKKNLGRDVRPGEIYVSHFMGRRGARDLILAAEADPGAPAAELFPRPARANPNLFYNKDGSSKAVGDLYDNLMSTVEAGDVPKFTPTPRTSENPPEPRENDLVTFGDIVLTPTSFRELPKPKEDDEADLNPSLTQGMKDAIDQEQILSYAFRSRTTLKPDPNYALDEEGLKTLTKGIPEQYWEWFSDAHSEDHAFEIRNRVMEDMEKSKRLEALGWTGVGLRVVANIIDPVALGVAAATGGVGRVALAGRHLGVGGKIAYGAVTNSAVGASVEGLNLLTNPHRGGMDILYGAAGGLILGGSLGPLMKNPATALEAAATIKIGKQIRKDIDKAVQGLDEADRIAALSTLDRIKFNNIKPEDVSPALGAAVRDAIRLLPDEVKLLIDKDLTLKGFGKVQGVFSPRTLRVALSMASDDIGRTVRHEAIHALRKTGILTQDHWKLLTQASKDNDWFTKFDVRSRWEQGFKNQNRTPQSVEDALMEESIAEGFSRWLKGESFDPPIEEVFTMMQKVANTFKTAFKKREISPQEEVEKLFRQIEDGKLDGQGLQVPPPPKEPARAPAGVGAQGVDEVVPPMNDADAFSAIQDADADYTALSKLRIDVTSQLKSSANTVARLFGGVLAEDAVGNVGHTMNRHSASESMERMWRTWMASYRNVYTVQWAAYKKSQGLKWHNAHKARGEFHDQAARYIRDTGTNAGENYDPAVVKLSERIKALQEDIRQKALNPLKDMGIEGRAVQGFEDVVENPNYLMRVWDHRKINDAIGEFGEGAVSDLVFRAMRSAQTEADEALLKRISIAFTRSLAKKAQGAEPSMVRAFAGQDVNKLKEFLTSSDLGREALSEADAKQLIKMLKVDKDPKGHSRGERRVLMDESFEITDMIDSRSGTGTGKRLSLQDLFNNDVDQLFTHYSRSMSGAIALGQIRIKDPKTGKLLVDGITSESEFEGLIGQMNRWGAENLERNASNKINSAAEENMRFIYDRIRGVPDPSQMTDTATYLRMLRKYNFIRVMNQVGFAQAAEAGVTLGTLGVRAALSQMPSFRRIINMDGESILKNGLAAELEAIAGVGTDRLRNVIASRYDDFSGNGLQSGLNEGGKLARFENVLDAGARITSDISGMSTINMALQRWTAKAVAQKFMNMAVDPAKINLKRMASIGLDEDMVRRVTFQMQKNASIEDGLLFKNKVNRMNLDKWDDLEAQVAFEQALFRWSRRIIQENDIGMMSKWMSKPMAQMITQFRTFMIGSWSKNLLHNVHMKDWETFASFSMSMVLAGSVYGVQENLKAMGRSDRDKRLRDRLTPQNIAKAAFARSGWAAMFPMMIDTGVKLTGGLHESDPIFDFRSSGQAADAITGNPSTGLFNSIADINFNSQKGMRSLQQVLPYQNFIPFSSVYSYGISGKPLHDRR